MFVVIEYVARSGSGRSQVGVHYPLRQDGHYTDQRDAMIVAEAWAADPLTPASMVAVAQIVEMVRKP